MIEQKMPKLCQSRLLYYNMKPGYVYPARNNKIVQLTNKVHLYMWHYYPDYNQWLFNYIVGKELYLVIDELNQKRLSCIKNMLSFVKMKYLKVMNMRMTGIVINGLASCAERICLKNVVFELM